VSARNPGTVRDRKAPANFGMLTWKALPPTCRRNQSLLFLFPVPDFVGFGILYSFGSVLTIMSTMFLVGPMKQVKNMLKKNRIIATVVYLASIGLTLFCAIGLEDGLLV